MCCSALSDAAPARAEGASQLFCSGHRTLSSDARICLCVRSYEAVERTATQRPLSGHSPETVLAAEGTKEKPAPKHGWQRVVDLVVVAGDSRVADLADWGGSRLTQSRTVAATSRGGTSPPPTPANIANASARAGRWDDAGTKLVCYLPQRESHGDVPCLTMVVGGGRCRIRTCVGVSRRIYSPSLLAFVTSSRVGCARQHRRSERLAVTVCGSKLGTSAGDLREAGAEWVRRFTRHVSLPRRRIRRSQTSNRRC